MRNKVAVHGFHCAGKTWLVEKLAWDNRENLFGLSDFWRIFHQILFCLKRP
jgi:hypothetical protein